MRGRVLSRDVRTELRVAITVPIQNQADLSPLRSVPERLGSEEQPQFKRHIESREVGLGVELSSGDVVDAELTSANKAKDLVEPNLTGVLNLKGRPRHKAAVMDRKNYGIE